MIGVTFNDLFVPFGAVDIATIAALDGDSDAITIVALHGDSEDVVLVFQ